MKIPKAKQLPSGSWFCRVRVNGQDIGITRPTEKEAVAEAMAVKAGTIEAKKSAKAKTVSAAIDSYISARENVLSPATIHGYRKIQRNRFGGMMGLDINKITQEKWQRAVNLEARRCGAKTLKNSWMFISSVIFEEAGLRISVRLPQVIPNERSFLPAEDIPLLLDALKGSDVEIAALLALSGLRQSEILGLQWANIDLENHVLHIVETAVKGENGLTRKIETKNTSSRRTVPIIAPLQTALEASASGDGYVVTMAENTIRRKLQAASEKAGVQYVGLHGLRHTFASLSYHLGLSEEVTMRIGGWSDIGTMRRIYTHVSDADISRQSETFTKFFESGSTKNGNENGNGAPEVP